MGIAIEGIADYEYADAVRYFVPGDGRLKYYIDRTGSQQGVRPTAGEVSNIDNTLKLLDLITGVELEEVDNPFDAQVTIFKARPGYYESEDTIGLTELDSSGIKISWVEQDTNDWREYTTIKHEIGHLFALRHPYGDGFNPLYDMGDTVMSYNGDYYSVHNYSDSDKLAMKSIWGEDQQAFVPGRGTHNGTVFADKFYLQTFDGYGEGSADVINGFNAANGDVLELTTNGAGWDPAKSTRTFYTISDRTEIYRSGWRSVWKRGKKKLKPVYSSSTVNDLDTVAKTDSSNISIYNTSTGQLYVDRNGSAYGLGDGGLIAVFNGAPSLTTADIRWYSG